MHFAYIFKLNALGGQEINSRIQIWRGFRVAIVALPLARADRVSCNPPYSSYSFQIFPITAATETEQNSTTAKWGVQGRNMILCIKSKYDPILKRVIFPSLK